MNLTESESDKKTESDRKYFEINDLNEKYDNFHDTVMQVVSKNVPVKELSNKEIKRKKKPWITKGIITSIHKRNCYLKKLKKIDNQFFFMKCKCYRDEINHLIRKNKQNYY